jgi:hypothetical protein
VIYLNKNAGHLAVWSEKVYLRNPWSFYAYTDSDIVPAVEKNPNLIEQLYLALRNSNWALKSGCAITIDDLPDHYAQKPHVIEWESKFWKKKISPEVYHADVDTTFALYFPLWHGVGAWGNHLRVAGNCTIRHLPWYEDSSNMTEESLYYKQHASTLTYWTGVTGYSVCYAANGRNDSE